MESHRTPVGNASGVFQLVETGRSVSADVLSKALKQTVGVLEVEVNLVTDKAYVTYDPTMVSPAKIHLALQRAGNDRAPRKKQRVSA